MLSFDTIRDLFERCDPYGSLPAGDRRYVDFDAAGEGRRSVRGQRWIQRMARRVAIEKKPVRLLFSGLTGSGKSTELQRLSKQLSDAQGLNLLAVVADADEGIDLAGTIDVPDILVMMLEAAERAVIALEGGAPAPVGEGALGRIWAWLTATDPTLRDAEFGVRDGRQFASGLRSLPDLRKRVRHTVATNVNAFRAEVAAEFTRLDERARRQGRSGIVVIVDSLEKLLGTSQSFDDVLDSVWQVFANGAPHLELPVHAVYTIPPMLLRRARIPGVFYLPMLKVANRDGSRFEPGYVAARKLIEQRVEPTFLKEILGEDDYEGRVDRIIQLSGGYPREIVLLLRRVVEEGERTLDEDAFENILSMHADEVRQPVPDYAFQWLAKVAMKKALVIEGEAKRSFVEHMLALNFVLRYQDDKEWFDLHPAVRAHPAIAGFIRNGAG